MSQIIIPIVFVLAWVAIYFFLKEEQKGLRFFLTNLGAFVLVVGILSLLAYLYSDLKIAVYYRAMIMFVAVTHVVLLFFYALLKYIDRKGF